jgi:shikimate kinase
MPARHIVMLGLMGSGKTSIGARVAEELGWPLIDGDVWLEERNGGRTAAEIADAEGIAALHAKEADVMLEALAHPEPAVIGPAASTIENERVRTALADHWVVWLKATAEYLAEHAVRKTHRPLMDSGDPLELFRRQLAVREPLVLPLAALAIDVVRLKKVQEVAMIVALTNT